MDGKKIRKILSLRKKGKTYKEIAREIGLSHPSTVHYHLMKQRQTKRDDKELWYILHHHSQRIRKLIEERKEELNNKRSKYYDHSELELIDYIIKQKGNKKEITKAIRRYGKLRFNSALDLISESI